MSNSAFTPSTTTVTNNVPTNVPVVTDWVAYTPTLTNFGSKGTTRNEAFWRRIGSDIEIKFAYTGDTTAAGVGINVLLMSLPSGLTFDISKSPTPGAYSDDDYFGTYREYSIVTSATYSSVQQLFPHSSTQFRFVKQGTGGSLATSDLNVTRPVYLTGEIRAPIAEWAGSGTTTLATRAVEEYAWNSNTADGNDTTSFAYGPSGVVFGSYTANRQKTVRFQSAILPTDSLAIEILIPGSTIWQPIQTANNFASIFVEAGATNYGMRFEPLNSTDVTIIFGAWRKPNSGTYAAAGAPWSDITTTRWRLRKVSSGAAVGYPVSARNIVGDTSGSVVPVGMLGETTTIANATSTSVPSGTVNITGLTQTLQSGTWLLIAEGQVSVVSPASGMTSGQVAYMDIRIQNTTDSTTTAAISNVAYLRANSATTTNGGSGGFNLTSVVTLTSQKSFQVQGTYQSSITGGTTQTFQSGKFYAIRIA